MGRGVSYNSTSIFSIIECSKLDITEISISNIYMFIIIEKKYIFQVIAAENIVE